MNKPLTLAQATMMVDTAIMYRKDRHWFTTGTREKAIEAIWGQQIRENVIERLSAVLEDGEVDWVYDDPPDPCKNDRWFYYHPSMVI